jgi:MoaA/NifB/PqqE/SkfB family radical SAM enzyme
MIFKLTKRILTEVDPKIQRIMFKNFCLKSAKTLKLFQKQRLKNFYFPAFLFISITNRCNLSCQGCWVSPTPPHDMPLKQINKIIDDAKTKGRFFFGILGGEPLMHPELFKIFEVHPDCYFQLFTNGTLLNKETALKLKTVGNVTPLISVEGLEEESDSRRGGADVFNTAMQSIENCTSIGLFTGVASSICKSNFDDLVNKKFIDLLISKKVHYMWYYIYRPVGPVPSPEKALDKENIKKLREFLVNIRVQSPILIIDSYWNEKGEPFCPGNVGLSHHVNPFGQLEFCPPIQLFMDTLKNGNTADIVEQSIFMKKLRDLTIKETKGCILMENPQLLADISKKLGGMDSSGRGTFYQELYRLPENPSHSSIKQPIPEKSFIYKFAKKRAFFGLGAYG